MMPFKAYNRSLPGRRTAVLLVAGAALLGGTGRSDADPRAVNRSAEGPLSRPAAAARWEREALRPALNLLAELYEVPIFLDRRIDPDALVSGDFPASPLGGLLEAIGSQHGFASTEVEGVIYLGPPATARRLRTLDRLRREDVRNLSGTASARLLAERSLEWPDLTSPRELIARVCRQARIRLKNDDLIPHDLWAANRFPATPRATQLTILLAGFDLTFDCGSDGTLTLRTVRDDEQWEEVYRLSSGRMHLVDDLQQELPSARLRVEGRALRVTGLVEEHEVVESWLRHGGRPAVRERPQATSNSDELRFHLRVVRRPLDEVLHQIEKATDYRFTPDRDALRQSGIVVDRLISFEVRQADIDALLKTLQAESGLGFQRNGKEIEVFVRPRP